MNSHSTTQKSLTHKRKAKIKEEGRTSGVLSAHVNPTSFLCLLEAYHHQKPMSMLSNQKTLKKQFHSKIKTDRFSQTVLE